MTSRTRQTRRSSILRALLAACVWLLPGHAVADDVFHTPPDFNGDGAADFVVGVPDEGYHDSLEGRAVLEAGAVDVVYGTVSGSAGLRPQHWTLASVHIIHGTATGPTAAGAQLLSGAEGEQAGWSVRAVFKSQSLGEAATWSRLLVGAPGSLDHGGAVKVFGPDAAGVFVAKGTLSQDGIFGPGERTEPGDGFGASVGAGGLPRITFKW